MSYNNNNELLFWKVFKNKFLINKILNEIYSNEWVNYNNPSNIHACNRLKFKHFNYLDHMLKNKQYEIIKYKLNSNLEELDLLFIDPKSIETLFNQLSISLSSSSSTTSKENSLKLVEILKLLLEKKKNEMDSLELIKQSIECKSIQVLKILTNEPYSMIVLPSLLEIAIKKSTPEIVIHLLSLQIKTYGKLIFDNNFIIYSLQWALDTNNNEMIDLILNIHPLLLNNDGDTIYTDGTNEVDQVKFSDIKCEPSNYFKYSDEIYNKLSNLGFKKSKETIYYNKFNSNNNNSSNSNNNNNKGFKHKQSYNSLLNSVSNYISKSFETYLQIYPPIDNSSNGLLKELRKFITIKSSDNPSFYKDYIIIYNETINDYPINDDLISNNDGTVKSNLINLFRFLYYFNNYKNSSLLDISILKSINIDEILNENNISISYPVFKYCENNELVIKNKEIIDWVIKYGISNNFELIELFLKNIDFKIESLELLEYFNEKLVECSSFSDYKNKILNNRILDYLKLKSIKKGNLGELKLIESMIETLSIENEYKDNPIVLSSSSSSSSSHSNFDIMDIVKLSNSSIEDLNKLLSNSVRDLKLKLLLNTFKNDNLPIAEIDINWYTLLNCSTFIYTDSKEMHYIKLENGEKIETLIEIIKLLACKIYKFKQQDSDLYKFYKQLLNFFYDLFIKIQNVKSNQLIQVYKFIKELSIEMEHSVYHSFYYLNIKSVKLSRYILTRPNIFSSINYYMQPIGYNHEWQEFRNGVKNKIEDYLDPQFFTAELIFRNSFDTLLNLLIEKISYIPNNNNITHLYDFTSESCNSNLEYCLEIKRPDLFFKQMDIIINKNQQSFTFSKRLIQSILVCLDFQSILIFIEQFIKNEIVANQFINDLYKQSIRLGRLDTTKLILNQFISIIPITNINQFEITHHQFSLNNIQNNQTTPFYYDYYNESKLILENYFDKVKCPILFKNQDTHQSSSCPSLDESSLTEMDYYYYQNNFDNIFSISFRLGDIRYCDLLLKYYPNYFIITKRMITAALQKNNIHIIIYYFNNYIKNDNELYDHLKITLKNHNDYKYLNLSF